MTTSISKQKLVDRLSALKPMPDDTTITQEQLDEWMDILSLVDLHFKGDRDFVGPLLDSVGYGDGFGAYCGISHSLFSVQDRKFVLNEIAKRIKSDALGPKVWALYTLAEFHKAGVGAIPEEHQIIKKCLGDRDLVRREAAHCLGALGDRPAREILKTLLHDPCEQVKSRAKEWLDRKD